MNTRYCFLTTILAVFCLALPLLSAEITDINPAQNALNVANNVEITVTFDSDMNPATINNQTLLVHGGYTGLCDGTVSYDSPTRTARFVAAHTFPRGEEISVTVTTGVETAGGARLDHSFIWDFTIIASPFSTGMLTLDSTYIVANRPNVVAAADIDHDNDIDIIFSNGSAHTVTVMLNNGSGTFSPPTAYAISHDENASSVFAADFNNDGYLDLVAPGSLSQMAVLLNDGSGAFPSYSTYSVPEGPTYAMAADLDADGYNDIVVNMRYISRILLFRNNGDGTFAQPDTCDVGNDPISVDAADLDKDGDLDLAVACMGSGTVSVLMNNGDGTFATQVSYTAGTGSLWLDCVDVHNDGNIDIVTANLNDNNVSVLRNYGSGTFASPVNFPSGQYCLFVGSTDIDGDGYLDLPALSVSPGSMEILFNSGTGTFWQTQSYPLSYGVAFLAPADLNGDGAMDIVGCNIEEAKIYVYLNGHPPCCGLYTGGYTGNTNCDSQGIRNLIDITTLIDRIYLSKRPLCCEENGNVNGDPDGVMNLIDVTSLIDHIYLSKEPTATCP